MNILVVTPHYLPDAGPSALLYALLSEALVRRGHEVTVIAAAPHYPSGRVPQAFRGLQTRHTVDNGVQVIRVPVPSVDRSRMPLRLAQLLAFQLRAAWAGLARSYEVALFSNPWLSTGLPLAVSALIRRKPLVFSIHDVYPNVGVTLKVFRQPWVIKFVAAGEQFCLKRAKYVRILSESFGLSLRALGVPEDKLALIYDWADTDLIQPLPRDNAFAREHDLVDKFVVLYAGNLGLSQGLEHVLAAAQALSEHADIQFVFVGDGIGRTRLMAQAEQRRLTNVRFIPYQSRMCLPEVMATADVSLVILQRGVGAQSLPSKSFSILASGRPIIASVDGDSDLAKLVTRSQAGCCVPPEDPAQLAEAILALRADMAGRWRMGRAGREYAVRHHSPGAAAEKFERLLAAAKDGTPFDLTRLTACPDHTRVTDDGSLIQ
jgi:colanic acid biosynthesis glycosyl transferase WcaI